MARTKVSELFGAACFYCWEHLTNHFPTQCKQKAATAAPRSAEYAAAVSFPGGDGARVARRRRQMLRDAHTRRAVGPGTARRTRGTRQRILLLL